VKSIKLLYIIVFLSLIVSAGCQRKTNEELPGIDLPLSEMNAGVKLLVPEIENNISGSPFTYILINNTSDKEYRLNKQSGIFIFEYVNKEWVPIRNLMDYGYGVEVIIYPENSGFNSKDSTVIVPEVTTKEENILLRVVCIGEYISPDGNTIKQAGAYKDFWLTPERTVISIDEESL